MTRKRRQFKARQRMKRQSTQLPLFLAHPRRPEGVGLEFLGMDAKHKLLTVMVHSENGSTIIKTPRKGFPKQEFLIQLQLVA